MKLRYYLILVVVFSFIVSCSVPTTPEKQPQPQPTPSKPETPDLENNLAETVDESFFERLNKVGEEYKKNDIWKGYDFASMPQYLIYTTGAEGKETAVRAFLLNPPKPIEDAKELQAKENKGLKVYRYDKVMEQGLDVLKKGNGFYDFDFVIEGQKFYLQLYKDNHAQGHEDVALNIHENFHSFQNSWDFVPGFLQDQANYPLTKDLIALQLLTLQVLKGLPQDALSKDKAMDLVKQYVAIRSREITLDPSATKLVKNMANFQEHGEGSAKYIELRALREGLDSTDNFIPEFSGYGSETTAQELRFSFAFGIWYDTGAAITYLLDILDVNIESEYAKGKTPFDVAENLVKLSDSEKAIALEKAQSQNDWISIQATAEELVKLK